MISGSRTLDVLDAHTTDHDGIAVLVVTGEIDMCTETSPRDAVSEVLERRPDGLVVDLRAVTFFGSSGINFLLTAQEHAERRNLPFAVVAAREVVLRPLAITGLGVQFAVFPELRDALTALRTPRPRRG